MAILPIISFFFLSLQSVSACFSSCRFKLCKPAPLSLETPQDSPQTSAICYNGTAISVSNSVEALAKIDTEYIPISSISPLVPPSFFKTFSLANGSAAVGHQTVQENFLVELFNDECVVLPLKTVQILKGNDVQNLNLNRSLVDCVSFKVISETPGGSVEPSDTPSVSATEEVSPEDEIDPSPTASLEQNGFDPIISITPSPDVDFMSELTSSPTASLEPNGFDPMISMVPSPDVDSMSELIPSHEAVIYELGTITPEPMKPTYPIILKKKVSVNETIKIPSSTGTYQSVTFNFSVSVPKNSGSTKEDLYLLSDATSSMGRAIAEVKERFSEIVASRTAVSLDTAFGVGYYRDENENIPYETIQSLTTNINSVRSAIDTLKAGNTGVNYDTEEGLLFALYKIATDDTIGWRDESRKILVYFGDAPGHEPSCINGLQLTRAKVIEALNQKKISVVAASFVGGVFSPGLNDDTTDFKCPADVPPAPTDIAQANAITQGTGGGFVEADGEQELIESILSSVSGLSQKLEAQTEECEKIGLQISFSPKLPLTIPSGGMRHIQQSVTVEGCGDQMGKFECKIKFVLSGVVIGEQTLKSDGLDECQ